MSTAEQSFEKAVYTTPMKPGMTGIHSTLINDNYVNKYESSISAVETQYSQSRYQATLSNPSFGATCQAYLPTGALIAETYINLRLGFDSGASTPGLTDDDGAFYLPQGWGLSAIQSINYTMPSDSIGQITITNDEIYHYLYCQEKEYTSTSLMLLHAGPCNTAMKVTDATNASSIGGDYSQQLCASILLPLPWCSLGHDTKPLDSNIFGSGQIFINITFANSGRVYQWKPAVGDGKIGVLKILEATLTYRQGEMTNKENSLKYLMLRNPGLIYDMPYIRSQYKSVGIVSLNNGMSTDGQVNTFISGLLNADLVGMCISVHYVPNPRYGGTTTTTVGNPYLTVPIYGLEVIFGGLTLYKAQNFSHRLYNHQGVLSSGYDTPNAYLSDTSTPLAPQPSLSSAPNFPHVINFSRLRSMNWDDHYFNVVKWNAQTFNIKFGVPTSLSNAPLNTPDSQWWLNNQAEVRISCFYNAVMELGQYKTQQRLL